MIPTIIFLSGILISFVWAIAQDNNNGNGLFPISDRQIALFVWILIIIPLTLIFGGIFWW